MADKLNLDRDETVLIRETCVAHGGVMAIYTDELILTNKRVICIGRGIFGGKRKTYIYPLDQLKVFNGEPQAKIGKLSNGLRCLVLYLQTGEEYFNFQSDNEETIDAFIKEFKKLYGCPILTEEKENKKSGILGGLFSSVFGKNSNFDDEDDDDEEDDEDDEDDEDEEEDESMSKYQLEHDEVIIKKCECVYVDGTIDTTADVVSITNKRLVIEYTTGFWNNKEHVDTFDFSDLKVYRGEPQVKLGTHDDCPVLELFFSNAQLYLNFDDIGNEKKQKAFIQECVSAICECIKPAVVEKPVEEPSNTNNDGIICGKCGKKNKPGVKFCTECGSKLEEPSNVVIKNGDAPKEKLTLDQQIELLQKLKGLVDAGVLSQEEFEAKKKEIL